MKQTFLLLFAAATFAACNNSGSTASTGSDTSKTNETKVASSNTTVSDLPYQVKDWGDWQPGSMDNLKTALTALKAWENGDVDASLKGFADSVEFRFDNMVTKVSKDSARAMLANERKNTKSMKIDMDDYETVKSKNGKEEWVSLWYKQVWEDNKGKKDSAVIMDDLKMVNGKIAVLDEKSRHLPPQKK